MKPNYCLKYNLTNIIIAKLLGLKKKSYKFKKKIVTLTPPKLYITTYSLIGNIQFTSSTSYSLLTLHSTNKTQNLLWSISSSETSP